MLHLRGGPALSDFRKQKLLLQLGVHVPGVLRHRGRLPAYRRALG